MSEYIAPLKDMMFVLNELAGLGDVARLPGCEEATPDLVEQVLEECGKFSSGVLSPLNWSGDQEGAQWKDGAVSTPKGFKQAYRKFVEGGWNALHFPPELGGQGLPKLVSTPVQEMWKSANMSFSLCPLLTFSAIEALLLRGTDAQKNLYLRKMIEGTWTGTMNLTEPQAGSDLAENIIHLVLARTPDAPEGVKGISLFVVPKFLLNQDGSLGARNDAKCVSIEHKLGIHASPTAVMVYGEKDGAIGYLVGEENRGLEYMFIMMNAARFAVGLEGVALCERAYQRALAFAKERIQSRDLAGGRASVSIIHHPDVRRMLMSMKSQTEATRALAYVVAAALDTVHHSADQETVARSQAFADLMIPVVKGWSTECGVDVASLGVQVHGGMGFIEETGAAQHLRDARITTIYEGTTGIQANDLVGRKIAREGGVTAKALIKVMRVVEADLGKADGEDFAAIKKRFGAAIDAFAEAVDWIVATNGSDIKSVYAGAVPFLKMTGILCGGWQMARAALVADKKLRAAEGDAEFLKAKIITARFFADHFMGQVPGMRDSIVEGASGVMALSEAQF
jgi:alkylation response protein AidB-like acyl-CoA dehydrogenase